MGFFVSGMMGRFGIVPKKVLEHYILEKITRLIPALMGKSVTINRINKGITNNNFKVIVDDEAFFISLPGTDSKLLNIDFTNKYYNNKICGDIGISPKVVHYIKTEELLVTEYINSINPVSKSFHGSEKISVLVKMIKTLHDAKPFYRNFNMFTYIYHYMNILKKLFGNLNLDVNNLVDELHSSPVEKKELKIKLTEILKQAESSAQEQVTRRWEADAKAGWLPANIRPLTLAFLTLIFVSISFFDGNVGGFKMNPVYVPVYQTLLMVVFSAYFAGRSIEKFKNK